jgi:hypothetical protein
MCHIRREGTAERDAVQARPVLAVAWNGGFGSRRLLYRANGYLIGVADGPYIMYGQGDDRLRVSGCSYELDLDAVRLIDFHHRAEITATQPVLGQVAVEYDGIEEPVFHVFPPGNAVTKLGASPLQRTIQTVTTDARFPDGPLRVPCTSYFWPYLVCSPRMASPAAASARKSASSCCHAPTE